MSTPEPARPDPRAVPYELAPESEAGATFVALAEKHAVMAAERAAEHDRAGTFPFEAIDAMRDSGFLRATVPVRHGGGGLTSVRDLAIGVGRLARADAGLAIAVTMHLTIAWGTARMKRRARDEGDHDREAALGVFLDLLGTGTIAGGNVTEPGTDALHPFTEARRVEGGWSLTGTKIFATLSPATDVLLVTARERHPDGDRAGMAVVFRGTPGQQIDDDWDALGMRSSGSGSVRYQDCVVPDALYLPGGAWGTYNEMLLAAPAYNLPLATAMLGIAEAAAEHAVELATTKRKGPEGRLLVERPGIRHAVAEMRAALSTGRALVDLTGRLVDEWLRDPPPADVGEQELHVLNAEFQAAKLVICRSAIDAVDRAMQISGGSGYLSSSPLGRHYRDVRAGPFMQIFSPNEAYDYVGSVTCGLAPPVDL